MEKIEIIAFFEWVTAIVKRPAMYGISNVEGIHLFILGYKIGRGSDIIDSFLSSLEIL